MVAPRVPCGRYVQRYLQANADLSRENSLSAVAKAIKGNVDFLEERMIQEFEHIHNALIAPLGSGAKVESYLRHLVTSVDRMTKGTAHTHAGQAVSAHKDKVRAEAEGGGPAAGGVAKQQSKLKSDRSAQGQAAPTSGPGGVKSHGPVKV